MPVSSLSSPRAASMRLFTWTLVSSLCVISALTDNSIKIMEELSLLSEDYNTLPNVQTFVDLASNATGEKGAFTLSHVCSQYATLDGNSTHTFRVKEKSQNCTVFIQAPRGWKLTFQITGLKLFPCEEEYLYLNDGATLESTLCDGEVSAASKGSRFLFVKFGRQTNTGTAFNLAVKAVPDVTTKPGIVNKSLLQERAIVGDQICKACGHQGDRARRGRVLGGTPARVVEYPWMVGIHVIVKPADLNSTRASISMCGGSILDRRHVLTAAHCVQRDPTSELPRIGGLFVVAGSDHGFQAQQQDLNSQIRVESWFAHPSYNPSTEEGKTYDIAVLRLAEELQFSRKVAPVCLAAPLDFAGTDVTVTGYGFVLREMDLASQLQAVKLTIHHGEECDVIFKGINRNSEFQTHQICLASPSKDACGGDSGGPAVIRWNGRFYQVGVVSFGLPCKAETKSKRHGGYTRVSSFIPWIKTVLEFNYTC